MGTRVLANILDEDMLNNEYSNLAPEDVSRTLPFLGPLPGGDDDRDTGPDLLPGDDGFSSSQRRTKQEIKMVEVHIQGSCVSAMTNESVEQTHMK